MIKYVDSVDGIRAENLHGFFAGWRDAPSPEMHLQLLGGSDHVVLAVDEDDGNVAGFITAISDGVLSAHIPLLEVLPAYQGQGIGQELTRRMLEKLNGLYAVDLAARGMRGAREILEHPRGFARQFAFVPVPEVLGGLVMAWVSDTLSC